MLTNQKNQDMRCEPNMFLLIAMTSLWQNALADFFPFCCPYFLRFDNVIERKLYIWQNPNLSTYPLWRSLQWVDEVMALSKVRRINYWYHRLHFLPSGSSYCTLTRKYLQIIFQVSGSNMIEFNENSPIKK